MGKPESLNKDISKLAIGATLPPLGLTNKSVFSSDNDAQTTQPSAQLGSASIQYTFQPLNKPPFESHLIQNTLWPEIDKLYGHGNEIMKIVSCLNRNIAASSCKATQKTDAFIIIWDTKTWSQIAQLDGHDLSVTGLSFNHDGDLVSCGRDRSICLWKLVNNEWKLIEKKEKAHSRIIWDSVWTCDGKHICSVSRDKTIKIWSIEGGLKCIATKSFGSGCTSCAFFPSLYKKYIHKYYSIHRHFKVIIC